MEAKDMQALLQSKSRIAYLEAATQRQLDNNEKLVDALNAADKLFLMLDLPKLIKVTKNLKLMEAAQDFIEKRKGPLKRPDGSEAPFPSFDQN